MGQDLDSLAFPPLRTGVFAHGSEYIVQTSPVPLGGCLCSLLQSLVFTLPRGKPEYQSTCDTLVEQYRSAHR